MRRLRYLLVLLLITLCLSGCGNSESGSFVDKVKACLTSFAQDAEVSIIQNKLSTKSWSADTLKAGSNFMEAVNHSKEVNSRTEDDYKWSFWKGIQGKGFTKAGQLKYDKEQAASKLTLSRATLNDCFEKDESTRDKHEKSKQEKHNASPLKWVLLFVAIGVLLFILLNKKKPEKEDTVTQEESQNGLELLKPLESVNIKVPDLDAEGRSRCSQLGLSWDEFLAERNNDKVKAIKELRRMK